MNQEKKKQSIRLRRKARVVVKGTALKPRLSVFRSLLQISAQIINDDMGVTLVSASSKDVKADKKKKAEVAKEVGRQLAEKAKAKGITEIVFDRNFYRYHGRVEALADGAREGGLKF